MVNYEDWITNTCVGAVNRSISEKHVVLYQHVENADAKMTIMNKNNNVDNICQNSWLTIFPFHKKSTFEIAILEKLNYI